jgi:hypothetical protein
MFFEIAGMQCSPGGTYSDSHNTQTDRIYYWFMFILGFPSDVYDSKN